MNLATLPDRRASSAPLAPAVADDAFDLDNTGLLEAVTRAAAALRSAGVGPGDVVALMLPNCAEFVVTLFAAWRLGAAVTPINPSLTDDEVACQVADSAAQLLVHDAAIAAAVPTLGVTALADRSGPRRGSTRRRARTADLHQRHHRHAPRASCSTTRTSTPCATW